MKTLSTRDRLLTKNQETALINHLKTRYKFSTAIAEYLVSDAVYLRTVLNRDSLKEGQLLRYLVKNTEPAGKPLKDCEYVSAKLTVHDLSDPDHRQRYGLKELKLKVIKRITDEAVNFGGVLSQEDIAEILFLDRGTVADYVKELEERGVPVYTRSSFTDQGRFPSHKVRVIKLFLLNIPETEIGRRTGHTLPCVETYIREFLKVALSLRKGNCPSLTARMTGLSLNLIKEYKVLYDELSSDPLFKEALEKTLTFFETGLIFSFKKGEVA